VALLDDLATIRTCLSRCRDHAQSHRYGGLGEMYAECVDAITRLDRILNKVDGKKSMQLTFDALAMVETFGKGDDDNPPR